MYIIYSIIDKKASNLQNKYSIKWLIYCIEKNFNIRITGFRLQKKNMIQDIYKHNFYLIKIRKSTKLVVIMDYKCQANY